LVEKYISGGRKELCFGSGWEGGHFKPTEKEKVSMEKLKKKIDQSHLHMHIYTYTHTHIYTYMFTNDMIRRQEGTANLPHMHT
jgi:hypothetical protein